MKISYSSAVCGAGKTHQIINRAGELARAGNNVLIVQPTKQLIDRTVAQELLTRPNPPSYRVFHGDACPGRSVGAELTDWLKTFESEGGWIVFITHQLLPHVPYFHNKQNWRVFVDEAPQVHDRHTLRIPHSHSLLTPHLGLEPFNAIYSRLVCRNAKAMTDIAQNKDHDAIFELLSEAARDVKNRDWECHVHTEQFHRLMCGEAKELEIYTVLSSNIFAGFRSVFMASANFCDTALYHLWRARAVDFDEDTVFVQSLRFDRHAHGDQIKILYAIDENWSRIQQKKTWAECSNETTLQLIAKSAADLLGEKPFVWQANKDDADGLRPLFGENQQLPHLAYGLNDYSDIDNAILLTASNPSPSQYRFLRNQGMESHEVRRAIYFQNAYQTVLRTSLRDPDNTEPKLIFVPDLPLAEHLQRLFPGSTIERLETGIPAVGRQAKLGRPRKHRTDRERKAQYRQNKKLELIRSQLLLERVGPYLADETLCVQSLGDETPIGIIPDFRLAGSDHFGTVFTNKYTTTAHYLIGTNVDEFIDWLERLSHRIVTDKEANQLISPAIFDPARDQITDRGLGNIVYLRHLWLDFEKGDLPPAELPKLFPTTRMVVMNSYHHEADKPRFRVLIPVRQKLTPDAYKVVWDMIAEKLEDVGYEVERRKPRNKGKTNAQSKAPRSGLDWSKRAPSSIFYLPCQAADPSQSFFVDYHDGREILNAEVWLKNTVVPFDPPPEPQTVANDNGRPVNWTVVDEATSVWRHSVNYPGEGNKRFWHYAVALRSAGMNLTQIEAQLLSEAVNGRSPKKRHAQVRSIMRSLRQAKRRVA